MLYCCNAPPGFEITFLSNIFIYSKGLCQRFYFSPEKWTKSPGFTNYSVGGSAFDLNAQRTLGWVKIWAISSHASRNAQEQSSEIGSWTFNAGKVEMDLKSRRIGTRPSWLAVPFIPSLRNQERFLCQAYGVCLSLHWKIADGDREAAHHFLGKCVINSRSQQSQLQTLLYISPFLWSKNGAIIWSNFSWLSSVCRSPRSDKGSPYIHSRFSLEKKGISEMCFSVDHLEDGSLFLFLHPNS